MKESKFNFLKDAISNYKVDLLTSEIYSNSRKCVVKQFENRGYMQVGISLNGTSRTFTVHQIVAYCGGLDMLEKTVNHIDGNKKNNSIENLESVTLTENIVHGYQTGLYKNAGKHNYHLKGEKHLKAKLTENDVREIRRLYSEGIYKQQELADIYGINNTNVSFIVNRKRWKHVA